MTSVSSTRWQTAVLIALASCCYSSSAMAEEDGLQIEIKEVDGRQVVSVAGLSTAELESIATSGAAPAAETLGVFAIERENASIAPASDAVAMFGKRRVRASRLEFVPKYPLNPRVAYRVEVRLPGKQRRSATAVVRLAAPAPAKPTRVLQIYPIQDTLPENQLKFYLHFSAPMSISEAYGHIHLFNADGSEVDYPFLKLEPELWDPAGTRFTLLIDPGRIKQGLRPREENGPALVGGRSYRLEIARQWRDAQSNPLAESYVKRFRVTAPDATQPAPSEWKFSRPAAGSREPLAIDFDEPLDHAMLQHSLEVVDPAGMRLEGKVQVADNARQWQFVPAQPWDEGRFQLKVNSLLEDLAGNSLDRPFEVENFGLTERPRREAAWLSLPLRIRSR
ncbi:MAG: hypothetical protein KDB14_15900 [Planctomycetales bacterium]|nr:hypothetical protein [Planctomycetales bacterium]